MSSSNTVYNAIVYNRIDVLSRDEQPIGRPSGLSGGILFQNLDHEGEASPRVCQEDVMSGPRHRREPDVGVEGRQVGQVLERRDGIPLTVDQEGWNGRHAGQYAVDLVVQEAV